MRQMAAYLNKMDVRLSEPKVPLTSRRNSTCIPEPLSARAPTTAPREILADC